MQAGRMKSCAAALSVVLSGLPSAPAISESRGGGRLARVQGGVSWARWTSLVPLRWLSRMRWRCRRGRMDRWMKLEDVRCTMITWMGLRRTTVLVRPNRAEEPSFSRIWRFRLWDEGLTKEGGGLGQFC